MEENLDKLFREKLSENPVEPSVDAWAVLENNLKQKRKPRMIWWYSAAAVALILVSVSLYVNQNEKLVEDGLLSQSTSKSPNIELDHKSEPSIINEAEGLNQTRQLATKKIVPTEVNEKSTTKIPVNESKNPVISDIKSRPDSDADRESPTSFQSMAMLSAKLIESPSAPMIQEIDLDDNLSTINEEIPEIILEENALNGNSNLPEVSITYLPDVQSETKLKKIIKKAKGLKDSNIGWGSLREAKNEMLASNFKKIKSKFESSKN